MRVTRFRCPVCLAQAKIIYTEKITNEHEHKIAQCSKEDCSGVYKFMVSYVDTIVESKLREPQETQLMIEFPECE